MRSWTYAQALLKVQRDMDFEEELFIDDDEFMEYFNDAIDDCESIILNLSQGYFRKKWNPSIVSGTAEYSMPSDIYANKIVKVLHDDGSNKYWVDKIKLKDIPEQVSGCDLKYDIQNDDATTGVEIVFYPTPDFTSSTTITAWYIRNANRVTATTDVIDIPEFMSYIFAHVKENLAIKEAHPLLGKFVSERERLEERMRQTLDSMVEDPDSTIEPDTSFYDDFDCDFLD